MRLAYLEFDCSEDELGQGAFEAMASTSPQQSAAVLAEVCAVLDWAHSHFPDPPAPLEDGGLWDFSLDGQREWSAPERLRYDPHSGRIDTTPGTAGVARHTVTLSLAGTPQFCDALRQQFELD